MKFSEIKNKESHQLHQDLEQLRSQLAKLRFELADKKLQDFSKIKKTKKEIAKILTAINQ